MNDPYQDSYQRHGTFFTGKSFSEALILASTIPQYDKRLFITQKLQAQNMARTWCVHKLFVFCFDILGMF